MTIKEYWQQLNDQQQRLMGCPLATAIAESICLDSKSVTIALGKDSGVTMEDGDRYNLEYTPRNYEDISKLFKVYSDDFITILEILTTRVDEVVEASTELLTIIVDEDIPELVLDRMAGASLGKEPAELVETIAKKRLNQLCEKVHSAKSPFNEVKLSVKIAKKDFEIDKGFFTSIQWETFGGANISSSTREHIHGTPQALALIANYQKLDKAVDRFIEMLRRAGGYKNG